MSRRLAGEPLHLQVKTSCRISICPSKREPHQKRLVPATARDRLGADAVKELQIQAQEENLHMSRLLVHTPWRKLNACCFEVNDSNELHLNSRGSREMMWPR